MATWNSLAQPVYGGPRPAPDFFGRTQGTGVRQLSLAKVPGADPAIRSSFDDAARLRSVLGGDTARYRNAVSGTMPMTSSFASQDIGDIDRYFNPSGYVADLAGIRDRRAGALSNLNAAIDTDVTTRWNIADDNDKNFYQEARTLLVGDYAKIGNSNQTTALDIVGNASGVRAIRMSRPSSGVTNSFGLTTDGFIFNNDTLGSRIAALLGSAVYGELSFSRAGSDHNGRQSVIRGGAAVGTDKDGASFDIIGSAGTGGATGGGAINFKTPNAGASGTTTQTETTKLSVQRQGNLILTELSSAPTLNAPNGSIFYGIIGGVTNFWFYRTNGWVGLP